MKVLLGVLLSGFTFAQLFYFAVKAWQIFLNDCPNNDFLSWDENLRLSVVIDQFNDFRDGNWLRAILPFFESPTWPPLQSVTSLILVSLPLDSSLAVRNSFHGIFFLLLVFPSLLYTSTKILGSFPKASLVVFLTMVLVLQTREVPVYSLSSMLETQSMFFLIWAVYALYRLFGEEESKEISGSIRFLIFFSVFGFYFTKYPYGILFMMSCFFVELLRNKNNLPSYASFLRENFIKGPRVIFLSLVFLSILSLPTLRLFSEINLNQRFVKQGLFYLSFLCFLDLSIFFYKQRENIRILFPQTSIVLWKYAFLPGLLWLYINPDRIGSLIDAQLIVNEYTKSFFLTLWTEPGIDAKVPGVFDFVWGFRIASLLGISSLIFSFSTFREKGIPFGRDPLLGATLAIFLELLFLELTTGNKQPRHVLQFLPALCSLSFIWILRTFEYAKLGSVFSGAILAGVSALVMGNLFYKEGLWNGNFFPNKFFCYRGTDSALFQPARDISNTLEPRGKYIIINLFHKKEKYESKGRVLASDFDLAIKQKVFPDGRAKLDNSYKIKDWSEYDKALLLSDQCPDSFSDNLFESRSKTVSANPKLLETFREPSGTACLQVFGLKENQN